jgi:hypothetical protein
VIQEGDRGQRDDTFVLVTLYVGQADVGNPIERHNRPAKELCLKSNIISEKVTAAARMLVSKGIAS